MISWLRQRSERTGRIRAETDLLVSELGEGAYSEARKRQREADSSSMLQRWSGVAKAIAKRTGKRVGLDTATHMAKEADFRVINCNNVRAGFVRSFTG
jgi:hypothetical protein